MYIIRRHLKTFGLDLVWDGSKVVVCQMAGRNVSILEEYPASSLATATDIMRNLEDRCHRDCVALA